MLLFTQFLITTNAYAFDLGNLNKIEDTNNKFLIKMGLKSIWISDDLNKVVFIRKNRPENLSYVGELNYIESTTSMSYVSDTYFFYNFKKADAEDFIRTYENERLNTITSNPLKKFQLSNLFFINNAWAECPQESSKLNKAFNFIKKMNSFLNGEQLGKLIGCAGEDPKIENEKPFNFSAKEFANYLKDTWIQLKEIIINLPNMQIPDTMKSQLMCDVFLLGVMIPEDMLLTSSVSAAPLALAQTVNATNRLIKTAKYINEATALSKYQKRIEEVFNTQMMMVKNLKKGAAQIKEEIKLAKNPEKIERLTLELRDWNEAELTMQKDLLNSAKKLNKSALEKELESQIKNLEHNLSKMPN